MLPIQQRYWAEIDLDSAEYNFKLIKTKLSDTTKLCCVVKADAYGHGAVRLSKLYECLGADYFAVSNIEEAIQLRKNDIKKPILILGYTHPKCAGLLSKFDIEQSVFSLEYARQLNEFATENKVNIKIHIKLDTGMGRIGFSCKKKSDLTPELDDAVASCMLKNLIPYGVFTHFAVADEKENGAEYTKNQYTNFKFGIDYMESRGISFKIKHCSNSAGILDYPDYQMDMVRAGIILYGLSPSEKAFNTSLKPLISLKAKISQVKILKKGECVSYGCKYKAQRDTVVATVPVGYADGLWRMNSDKGYMLVNGKKAKIIGRICMDQTMLDVTDNDNIKESDTVVIIGQSGGEYISVNEIASNCETINYEIVCAIGKRVPRIYIKSGKIFDVFDNILDITESSYD